MANQDVSKKRYGQVNLTKDQLIKEQILKNCQVHPAEKVFQNVHLKTGTTLSCLASAKDAQESWFWEGYPF